MKTYKAKQNITNGVLPNTNGQPNILFRKGDAIVGQEVEKFILNQNMKGILAKPTVSTARIETPDGLAFVPFSEIDIVVDNSEKTSTTTNDSSKTINGSSNPLVWTPFKKGIAATLTIAAIIGVLKLTKVI